MLALFLYNRQIARIMDNLYRANLEIAEHTMESYIESIRKIDMEMHVLIDLFNVFHEEDMHLFEKQLSQIKQKTYLLIGEAKIIKDIVIDCKKQRL